MQVCALRVGREGHGISESMLGALRSCGLPHSSCAALGGGSESYPGAEVSRGGEGGGLTEVRSFNNYDFITNSQLTQLSRLLVEPLLVLQ